MKLNQINIRQLKVASVNYTVVVVTDEVAEWPRRWTANPLCSARVGSNPTLVERFSLLFKYPCKKPCILLFLLLSSGEFLINDLVNKYNIITIVII